MENETQSPARGWKQLPNGDVQITLSRYEYDELIMTLGYAAGAGMLQGEKIITWRSLRIGLHQRRNESL